MSERLCTALSSRIADLLEFSTFREEFVNQVGKFNVAILTEISQLYLSDFGIFIEVAPDEEQEKLLEQNIQMALSKEDISLEDAIDIREIRNIKLANQMLKVRRKAKADEERQAQAAKAQQQAQINQQSQQMAAQAAMQKMQMETKAAMEIEQAKAKFSVEKMKGEAAIKSELMKLEFQLQMQLQKGQQEGLKDRESARERAKADRITQGNTQQSELIQQRKNNLPPIKFESNEDSLDGFDLAEFEPR